MAGTSGTRRIATEHVLAQLHEKNRNRTSAPESRSPIPAARRDAERCRCQHRFLAEVGVSTHRYDPVRKLADSTACSQSTGERVGLASTRLLAPGPGKVKAGKNPRKIRIERYRSASPREFEVLTPIRSS